MLNEKQTLQKTHEMCVESLSPENFQKWEEVKEELKLNRQNLKDD